MEKVIITLIVVILSLIAVCFVVSLILAKNTKEFHISFSWKGFDISGSFFDNNNSRENRQ